MWIKEVKLKTRGLDPLGLSRVSEDLLNEFLPGITTTTDRGRNYVFYCWAVFRANDLAFESENMFNNIMTRYEAAYVIGGLLDAEDNFPNSKGPIGRNRGLDEIARVRNRSETLINVNFSVLKHQRGGFGQYYFASMERLGLLYGEQDKVVLSSIGIDFAKAFERNIAETDYFNKFIEEDEIPLEILKKYGERCSYLRLDEFTNERNLLCNVLFSQNPVNFENTESRKLTLILILDLFLMFTDLDYNLTDDDFRNFIYFGHTLKEDNLINYTAKNALVEEIMLQWRFFQFHEHFTFVMEHIFVSFIKSLEDNPLGLSKSKFLENNQNFVSIVEGYLNCELKEKNLNEIFSTILSLREIESPLNKQTSQLFDKKVKINDKISEYTIRIKITQSIQNHDYQDAIAYSISLLLVLVIRYWQYQDSLDGKFIWIRNREYENWSIFSFIQSIRSKMDSYSLNDLFVRILTEIIEQHDFIANDKIYSGNDTFRFQQKGDIFFFKMSYEWVPRTDRFDSIVSLFEDLGLIRQEDDIFIITPDGKTIISEFYR